MRYLIAETSWPLMALASELATAGVLLTRTDRPEDIPQFLQTTEADLLVLDASDLDRPGLSLTHLRRLHPELPIVLMSRDPSHGDIVRWLDSGADTVLDASVPPEEAVMVLAAIARRAHGMSQPVLRYGPLAVNLQRRKAYLNDCPVKLSPKLYELLEYIALRPGRLVSRAALLGHIYGLEDEPDPRVFDVYVCNLRACLEVTEGAVDIETVRGSGYRFTAACLDAAIAA
ncbi:response regulator transcription factor [Mameliella sediminis]|uniref:response regulator transcription factor n=1 Tax=Mameliella sediminis TaxID=2836866 RepID=UPI001C494EDC|nr:response regulator transcription factor [Mameliella sediminis]MBV7394813.1 response regulator transcription factor [Mameliella sediminis]MBY6159992.1 response regulator transcription factor [Mameliella alba]MBY6168463.1 response regulator transcription factor [Mameliella alba]MBY6173483.1 response regulator transcription factor [Mameliella alba]